MEGGLERGLGWSDERERLVVVCKERSEAKRSDHLNLTLLRFGGVVAGGVDFVFFSVSLGAGVILTFRSLSTALWVSFLVAFRASIDWERSKPMEINDATEEENARPGEETPWSDFDVVVVIFVVGFDAGDADLLTFPSPPPKKDCDSEAMGEANCEMLR